MFIDLVFAVLMVIAIVKGFSRGFIVALFSFLAFMIGLAAALKLSAVVAGHIGDAVKISGKWLPIISFIVVFLVVILLVRLGARFIEKTVQWAMLGWLNRLGGALLYMVMYTLIYSVVLFYADQIHLIKPSTRESSVTYGFVQPFGEKVIEGIGKVVPFFKDIFADLENFFDGVSGKIPPAN